MLLIGDPVRGGLYGGQPDLKRLDQDGNLKCAVDFRSVYQEILNRHPNADSHEILGGGCEKIDFLK